MKNFLVKKEPAAAVAPAAAKEVPSPKPGTAVAAKAKGADPHRDSWRETVESIVVAFMLAFLFRTFLMEAFVIPTGSMAEALYGRHKDVDCEECGTRFRVGASDEVDRDAGYYRREGRVQFGFCPNCRYGQYIKDDPPFKGDRILVDKFPYEFASPQRWDVVVFKYPEDPKTNYIKRMIGLPGETITIEMGDIHNENAAGELEIRRKPPDKQRAIQMLVYDDDHPPRTLLEHGWPERWRAEPQAQETWKADPAKRTFESAATAEADWNWLRYRHIVPSGADWDRVLENAERGGDKMLVEPQPLLVSDYYSYNSGYEGNNPVPSSGRDMIGEHWVGDLTLNCQIDVKSPQGELALELVEGGTRYRCTIDLRTGEAALVADEGKRDDEGKPESLDLGRAPTPMSKAGKYRVTYANVDDRLCLWVNDNLIPFPGNGEYVPDADLANRLPTDIDLAPIGIATKGAEVLVAHLSIQRDLYYTNVSDESSRDWRLLLANPKSYGEYIRHVRSDSYRLSSDEFFVLGDNSPRSADSRLWDNRRHRHHYYAVPRNLLLGKAFVIYWPHAVPFLNHGRGYAPDFPPFNKDWPFPLSLLSCYHKERIWNGRHEVVEVSDYPACTFPFYPQFSRMKRIR